MNVQKNAAVKQEGLLTQEEVRAALPTSLRNSATPELVEKLNTMSADPIAAANIRENFIGYVGVLQDGRFKMTDYLNAVTYVSFKLLNYTNLEAWKATFQKRYAELVARQVSQKDLSAYAASYHRNKLVAEILERSFIPTWIVNQDTYQKAINIGLDIALNSGNDIARASAVNTLLTHLKRPESIKVDVDVNVTHRDPVADLEAMLIRMARVSREQIEEGNITAKQVAATKLIEHSAEDAEFTEVGDGQ